MISLIDVSFNLVMFYLKAPNKYAVIYDMIRNGCKGFWVSLMKFLFITDEIGGGNV